MELGMILSWLVGGVGLIGFYFSGQKKWWAWYINLGCQALWIAYALVTGQPAFLVTAAIYSGIFAVNAYKWTKEHRKTKALWSKFQSSTTGTVINYNGVDITKLDDTSSKHSAGYNFDLDLIARVCHEANRVLQLNSDDENPSHPWHLAHASQKKSAIEGVKTALEGATAEELHEAWVRQKMADGWFYGPFKDEAIKTHPCLVPYSELPEEQRLKDHMFRAIVKSFKIHNAEKTRSENV